MVFGFIGLSFYTVVDVIISLVAIVTGLVAAVDMTAGNKQPTVRREGMPRAEHVPTLR